MSRGGDEPRHYTGAGGAAPTPPGIGTGARAPDARSHGVIEYKPWHLVVGAGLVPARVVVVRPFQGRAALP